MAVIHHGSLAVVRMTCLSGLVAIAFSPAVTAAFAADQPASVTSVQTRTGGHSRFSGHHASGGHVSNRQNPTVLESKPHFRTFVGPHRLFVPFLGFDGDSNVTVAIPETSAQREEPVGTQPRSPSPAVLFIEKCGRFIRVPLPEAQSALDAAEACE